MGNVAKALHLRRVQVHRDRPVDARHLQHVRHQPRRDGRAAGLLLVLPRVTKYRHDRRDPLGVRAPQRVDHDQQLHDVVVRARVARRLHDVDVAVPHRLVHLDVGLAVLERRHAGAADARAQQLRDAVRELRVRAAREELQRAVRGTPLLALRLARRGPVLVIQRELLLVRLLQAVRPREVARRLRARRRHAGARSSGARPRSSSRRCVAAGGPPGGAGGDARPHADRRTRGRGGAGCAKGER